MIQAIAGFLGRHTPACREITAWASQGLDRPLSARERILMRLHTVACHLCKRYVRQLRLLRIVLRRYASLRSKAEHPAVAALSPEARERLKRRLAAV